MGSVEAAPTSGGDSGATPWTFPLLLDDAPGFSQLMEAGLKMVAMQTEDDIPTNSEYAERLKLWEAGEFAALLRSGNIRKEPKLARAKRARAWF